MKLYKFFIFSLLTLGLFSIFGLALAVEKTVAVTPDTNAIPLARVNILDAKITSSNENTFNISFKFTNGEGLQGGVRYGVRLFSLNEKGQPVAVADEKIYPEVISLAPNSVLDKEVVYNAPKILDGNFMLAVFSENESGFPFGLLSIGKVNLTASLKGVKILNETCSARLEKKDSKESLKDLIVEQGDVVRLTCIAVNSENEPVSVVPYFETTRDSVYGQKVEAIGGDVGVITFNKLEKKTFSVVLPQPKDPRTYYTKVMLKEGAQYSNAFGILYVMNGISASIENLFFDKDYFSKEDVANLSILWTSQTKANADFSLNLIITDKSNDKCGEVINQVLSQNSRGVKTSIPVTITKDCVNPSALVTIKDNTGKFLDEKTFNIETKSIDVSEKKLDLMTVLIIIGIVLIIIIGFILYMKKKNKDGENSTSIPPQMVVLLFLIGCCFLPFNSVKADTFYFPGGSAAYASINFDKYLYADYGYLPANFTPAGVITATTTLTLNAVDPSLFNLKINGISIPTSIGSTPYIKTFPVTQTIPGSYSLPVVLGKNNGYLEEPECYLRHVDDLVCPDSYWVDNWSYSSTSIPYRVSVPAPVVTVTTNASGGKINSGNSVNVTWSVVNTSPATTCTGSMLGTNLDGSPVVSRDFTGGLISNLSGVPIPVSGKTTFKVTCKNSYTAPVGSCSGSYSKPSGGVCSGGTGKVAGSIGIDGSTPGPYEGMLCSLLDQEECNSGWLTHGCVDWTTTYTTTSCSGLTQSSCNANVGCSWVYQ